ncbi:MAG TPA: hypothetical protein EYP34_10640 [Chromatiaceae bacterium]|nr:hypothetical protein [Chromatiaceae bacterium]
MMAPSQSGVVGHSPAQMLQIPVAHHRVEICRHGRAHPSPGRYPTRECLLIPITLAIPLIAINLPLDLIGASREGSPNTHRVKLLVQRLEGSPDTRRVKPPGHSRGQPDKIPTMHLRN